MIIDKCESHSAVEAVLNNQSKQIAALTDLALKAASANTIKWGIGIMVLLFLSTVAFLWQGQVSIRSDSEKADKEFTQKIDTVAVQERMEREKIIAKLDNIKEAQILIKTHLEHLSANVNNMKSVSRLKQSTPAH